MSTSIFDQLTVRDIETWWDDELKCAHGRPAVARLTCHFCHTTDLACREHLDMLHLNWTSPAHCNTCDARDTVRVLIEVRYL